jgi:GMP synthase (glutamine-hydrolysing)
MQQILILDFGSQYTQLIARRIRELHVFCEIHPYTHAPQLAARIAAGDDSLRGVILSGSPCSVRDADSPNPELSGILGQVPVLGICYGAQLLAQQGGGEVLPATIREYGRARLTSLQEASPLLTGLHLDTQVWMSHGDTIKTLPAEYNIIASTPEVAVAAYQLPGQDTYGIQFHPEVTHSTEGKQLLENFVVRICGCDQSWTPEHFVDSMVTALQNTIGPDDQVILGLSGGVDSSVAALLLHRAVGPRLHGIFVDNGLLRQDEFASVLKAYEGLGLNVTGVNAAPEFYAALAGISDPELKRKAIGRTFIEVFDREAQKVDGARWLAQGTIYPDVIESVSVHGGPAVTIKSHHNVGGLPEKMNLKIVEPLRMLFKDEVREVGATLGLPADILNRHPFPGPGLGIRILGDITPEKVDLLQRADAVFINLLKERGLYATTWQAGAMLLPVQSVGVMGDERTYERVVALRAVTSVDGMTADWAHLPYDFLAEVSNKIINQVRGINRVVYDISSKPPATIEWE